MKKNLRVLGIMSLIISCITMIMVMFIAEETKDLIKYSFISLFNLINGYFLYIGIE